MEDYTLLNGFFFFSHVELGPMVVKANSFLQGPSTSRLLRMRMPGTCANVASMRMKFH